MTPTTVFQVSIYSLTALSGLMLSIAEEAPFPSGLTPFLCALALIFNERRRLVRLNLLWSNVFGLGALGLMLYEFFGERADARLMAGAHFLVYLIWVVLFQDKRAQQYWWMFALGLLQVAIGTVMTLSGWYGLMMLSYLLLALWTMAVFHVHQQVLAFEAPLHVDPASAGSERFSRRQGIAAALGGSAVEDAVQQDLPGRWITMRFVVGVVGISVLGLTLGMAMFLLVPRVWLGNGNVFAQDVNNIRRTLTGISNEVRLGHLGKILESVEPVMEVRFFDVDSRRLSIEEFTARQGLEEPLFRGSVFESYDAGRWSVHDHNGALTPMNRGRRRDPAVGMLRQEYILQPQRQNVLYAMQPINAGLLKSPDAYARPNRPVPESSLEINIFTHVLSPPGGAHDRLEYVIFTRPKLSETDERVAARPPVRNSSVENLLSRGGLRQECEELPNGRLSALREMAASWTTPDRLIGNGSMSEARRRALTIEARLRDSGEFKYSLNMEIKDPDLDPVEDFLLNRKSGHCEYYAAALALMLRAVGIPSRLVTGFKGADAVNGGEYYEVQQRHAHAWVEAYVDNGWIDLDGTPPDRDESVRSFSPTSEFWKSATNSLSALWSTYVVSMSQNRQKETLYDPFTGTVTGGLDIVNDALESIQAAAGWIKDQLTSPERLVTGQGGLALLGCFAGLALVAVMAWQAFRWFARRHQFDTGGSLFSRWLLRLTRRWGGDSASRRIVEFYERFLALVGARGLRPLEHQTQREFARQVEAKLAEPLQKSGLASLPREVVDLYYQVRFGQIELTATELSALDDRIRRLAEAMRSNGARHLGTEPGAVR